jgi:hypothetical protein
MVEIGMVFEIILGFHETWVISIQHFRFPRQIFEKQCINHEKN